MSNGSGCWMQNSFDISQTNSNSQINIYVLSQYLNNVGNNAYIMFPNVNAGAGNDLLFSPNIVGNCNDDCNETQYCVGLKKSIIFNARICSMGK